MSEKQELPVEEKKREEEKGIKDYLEEVPGKPTNQQIEEWKAEHGDIFVSGFSESEMYIWRPVQRKEWVHLQTEFQGAVLKAQEAQNASMMPTQFELEEEVLDLCLIWKSKEVEWAKSKGGTVSSLYEQIMQKSNFVNPQGASLLVAKL